MRSPKTPGSTVLNGPMLQAIDGLTALGISYDVALTTVTRLLNERQGMGTVDPIARLTARMCRGKCSYSKCYGCKLAPGHMYEHACGC